MSEGLSCPDLEDLAAVADGRAPDEVRDRVLRHVADCEDCYETLVDTLKFNAEEARAAVPEPVATHPQEEAKAALAQDLPNWPRYVPPALAAGLLVALLVPVVSYLALRTDPSRTLHALATALQVESQPQELAAELTDNLDSGLAFAPAPDSRRLAFRLGVRLVDLEVARFAGDRVWQNLILREMRLNLQSIPDLTAQTRMVQLVSDRVATGLSRNDTSNLEAVFQPIEENYLALGQWAESSRLAAATRRGSFLVSPEFQQGLEQAQSLGLGSPESAEIDQIGNLVKEGVQSSGQWEMLRQASSDLIGLLV